jgi:cell wall-associated NlpC family hydrolase
MRNRYTAGGAASAGRRALLLLAAVVALMLQGCAGLPTAGPGRKTAPNAGSPAQVRQLLDEQYRSWKGVPYRRGGTTRRGVDCSGLVYITYRDLLKIDVPRTTKELAKTGKGVSRQRLSAGDLVFFKTGLFTRHVGIYTGGGAFLHSSSSSGVTLSSLDSSYWKRRYWKGRRLR